MSICKDCEQEGITVKHHPNKKRFPDRTVDLCPNCHAREHQGMLLFANKASAAFWPWLRSRDRQGLYTSWKLRMARLAELGYKPRFDVEVPQ